MTTTTLAFCAHIDRRAGATRASTCPTARSTRWSPARTRAPAPTPELRWATSATSASPRASTSCSTRRASCAASRCASSSSATARSGASCALRSRRAASTSGRDAPPVASDEVGVLRACDALLVSLRNQPLLGDFIPSKLYDAMAVGRPASSPPAARRPRSSREDGCGLVVEPEDGPALAPPSGRWRRQRAGRAAGRGRARRRRESRRARTRSTARDRSARRGDTGMRRCMCGIVGVVSRDGTRVDPSSRRRCATRWCTAAPTTTGVWRADDGAAALGHRRLAIIDLARPGAQPMSNEDGTRPGHLQRRDLQPRRAARRARGARATSSARTATPR